MVRQAEQQERTRALEEQGAILAKALQESLDKSVALAVNDQLSKVQLALLSSELQHKCAFPNGSLKAVTDTILAKPAGDRVFTGLVNAVIARYAGGNVPRGREARAKAAFFAIQSMDS